MPQRKMIEMEGIVKQYYIGTPNELEVLHGIDLTIAEGEFLSIVGASGSGKSTLMNIIGALDRPTTGSYTLDGELALAYARERHTQGGDVDRARRQQEVIISIRNRIIKFENLPELIAKAPALYQDLSSGIYTNLNLQEAIQLGMLGLQLDISQIKKGIIDYEMVIPTKSPEGEAILKPIPDKIRVLRDELNNR